MRRRWVAGSAVLLSLLIALFLSNQHLLIAGQTYSDDFGINLTAAHAVRQGIALYDQSALRGLASSDVLGGLISGSFQGTYTSYIGPPTTAVMMLPFTWWPAESSIIYFRMAMLGCYWAAIALVVFALPRNRRVVAAVVGVLAMAFWPSVYVSLGLGNTDGFVVLMLALGVALVTSLPFVAGLALGVATLLKISPGLLLVYALMRRQWRLAAGMGSALGLGLVVGTIPRGGRDLMDFVLRVSPRLSSGLLDAQNQSLGAWIARMTADAQQYANPQAGLGAYRFAGIAVALVMVLWLWSRREGEPFAIQEISTVILASLIAGPITWDHYLSWAIVPAMVLVALSTPPWQYAMGGLALALFVPASRPDASQAAASLSLRASTGLQPLALMAWCVVAILEAPRWSLVTPQDKRPAIHREGPRRNSRHQARESS